MAGGNKRLRLCGFSVKISELLGEYSSGRSTPEVKVLIPSTFKCRHHGADHQHLCRSPAFSKLLKLRQVGGLTLAPAIAISFFRYCL